MLTSDDSFVTSLQMESKLSFRSRITERTGAKFSISLRGDLNIL